MACHEKPKTEPGAVVYISRRQTVEKTPCDERRSCCGLEQARSRGGETLQVAGEGWSREMSVKAGDEHSPTDGPEPGEQAGVVECREYERVVDLDACQPDPEVEEISASRSAVTARVV